MVTEITTPRNGYRNCIRRNGYRNYFPEMVTEIATRTGYRNYPPRNGYRNYSQEMIIEIVSSRHGYRKLSL